MSDFRLALRQLAAKPGFTAAVVLTLALGIGATTAIFSIVHAVLLAPLPYPNPHEVVQVYEMPAPGARNSVSGGAFKDWKANSTGFAHLAIAQQTRINFTGAQDPEDVAGLRVSSEFLPVFGIDPALGRGFAVGEDTPGAENRIVVLAHGFWQRRFGGDRDIIGKTVSMDQESHVVIGVLPPNALMFDEAQFLVPVVIDGEPDAWRRAGHWSAVFGRLAPGVSASEAQAELASIKQRLNAEYPIWKQEWSVGIDPMREMFAAPLRPTLMVLLGAVAFVLLIACVNVSNLLLARGQLRGREMAVRAALGASRSRVIRQVLSESLLLAAVGCLLGLLLAFAGVQAIGVLVAGSLPHMMLPSVDLPVLFFSIAVAAGCGLLFGLLPALRAGSLRLVTALKDGERGAVSGTRMRAQRSLLVAQFAFTLVLLVGAGLFLRSFVQLLEVDPGFNSDRILAFDLSLPAAKYPQDADRARFVESLSERIAAIPGVEAVGSAAALPLSGRGQTEMASRAGEPRDDYLVGMNWVSGSYFDAMGITLQRGRVLGTADNTPDAPSVAVINARVARELFSDSDPVGERVHVLGVDWEIVGVVDAVRHFGLHFDATPAVYAAQARRGLPPSMVLRTALAPMALADAVREAVSALDPEQPITNLRTLEQEVQVALAPQRTMLVLIGLFAAAAIALACIGIYGVMSYTVGLRLRELSVRAALGARRRDIVRLVLSGGMKAVGLGVAVGLLASFLLAGLVESLLYEVNARDPLVLVASIGLLVLVAALGVWLPARRAARTDPLVALRYE